MVPPYGVPTPLGVRPSSPLATHLLHRARERRVKGVRAAMIHGRDGARAIVRLPRPVATVSGIRRLGLEGAAADAMLAQRLYALDRARRAATYYTAGAVALQQIRDIGADARYYNLAPPFGSAIASADYTAATVQTALAVAAVPAAHRTWWLSALPIVTGVGISAARETIRPATPKSSGTPGLPGYGAGSGRKSWWELFTLAAPAITGVVAAYMVRPARARRPVRY
jgi:hypothetical protein